jgi:type IX secretion system PorP/SprF family membrane protein
MRKILLSLSLLGFLNVAQSQQLHYMSQYIQHNVMFNPAAAGMSQNSRVGLAYRSMWSSFPGNPKTSIVYGDFKVESLGAGIGAYLYKDETGATSRTGAQLAYSYHINMNDEKSKLGVGLELRGLQYAVNKSALSGEGSLGTLDPAAIGASNKFVFDGGAGVYFTNDKLSIGASGTQLLGNYVKLVDYDSSTQRGRLYRQFNFMASYKIQTGDDVFLIPNAMLRVLENAPTECDLGVMLNYRDRLWWAMNWRLRQSWSLQAGMKLLKQLRATYSYDFYVAPISVFTNGSGGHEIGLQFDLKNKNKN